VALVTGANAGIGRAVAATLSDSGAAVVGLNLTADPRDDGPHFDDVVVAGELVVGDVGEPEAVEGALAAVDAYGELHVAVNNAGIAGHGRIDETTLAEWRRSFRVHVEGTYHVCSKVLPAMADRGEASSTSRRSPRSVDTPVPTITVRPKGASRA
jgi:NAD(P)-dependent dehydrogenase (short-subunit alcohol dehydrogenase family)